MLERRTEAFGTLVPLKALFSWRFGLDVCHEHYTAKIQHIHIVCVLKINDILNLYYCGNRSVMYAVEGFGEAPPPSPLCAEIFSDPHLINRYRSATGIGVSVSTEVCRSLGNHLRK